jgi:hypothetical protein
LTLESQERAMTDTPARSGATTEQLKHAIDSGETADKVPGFDPAAAPLGTDDEAAGTPNSPAVVAEALDYERRPELARRQDKSQVTPADRSPAPDGSSVSAKRPPDMTLAMPILVGGGAGVLVGAALWFLGAG